MRLCKRCGTNKPLSEFHKSKAHRDGHVFTCKACRREYELAYRDRHGQKERERRQAYNHSARGSSMRLRYRQAIPKATLRDAKRKAYAIDPSKVRQRAIANRLKRPQALKAHNILNRAVAAGRIVRPTECSKCGGLGHRIEAHHHDYSKPLDVAWLCAECHRQHHARGR